MPDWQRIAGKAAKEVEKFAKDKADIVLMHWRDKMGIAQKEVNHFTFSFLLSVVGVCAALHDVTTAVQASLKLGCQFCQVL